MDSIKVGFAFCGSFCTYAKALETLERVKARYGDVTPIVSPSGVDIDTRFGNAHDHLREMERICDRRVIDSIAKAEPIGPKGLLDVLVICPCTGNTLGKLAGGITDTAVTMAAKSHLRNQRPVVIAMASNDGLSGAAKNIGSGGAAAAAPPADIANQTGGGALRRLFPFCKPLFPHCSRGFTGWSGFSVLSVVR